MVIKLIKEKASVFINKSFVIELSADISLSVEHQLIFYMDVFGEWKQDVSEISDILYIIFMGNMITGTKIGVFTDSLTKTSGANIIELVHKQINEYYEKLTTQQIFESVGLKI